MNDEIMFDAQNDSIDSMRNVNIYGNLTVDSLNVTLGESIHLAWMTMENHLAHTDIDTDLMVHNERSPTAYLGVHAFNNSNITHANLILEAGSDSLNSVFNIVKNGPLHDYSPNSSGIINEGNHGTFIEEGKQVSWWTFSNFAKDEYGNIEWLSLEKNMMTLNDAGLFINGTTSITGTTTITNGLFSVNDGTRERIRATNDITALTSGDGDFEIKATGSEASFGYNFDYLRMNTESLVYRLSSADRIKILTTESIFKSPDSNSLITLDNTGTSITGNLDVSGSISVDDIISSELTLSANLNVTGETTLGDDMHLPTSWFLRDPANTPRLSIGTSDSELGSPDGDTEITLDDVGAYITSRGFSAFDADATRTKLYSPDNNYGFEVKNNIIDAQTTWFNIGDGARTRFDTKTDRIGLWSPDGTSSIILNNSGTTITSDLDVNGNMNVDDITTLGNISVCNGNQKCSFTLEPYSEHYSGGSMVFKGADKNDADPGPLTYYENYHIDNFWGYMRVFTSANTNKYMQFLNVGAGDMLVGINIESGNPTQALDVNGTIRSRELIKLDAITLPTCDGSSAGSIGRNTTKLYFCDGSAWNGLY